MSTTFALDLDTLWRPISDDAPAGVDLRAVESGDNPLRGARDFRGDARRAEKKLAEFDPSFGDDPPDPLPHWQSTLDECQRALIDHSKDLEIVAYAIEALVRLEGFAGLHQGLMLANGLIERFWGSLFPAPEERNPAATVHYLAQLNGFGGGGVLLEPLRFVPLTRDSQGQGYAFWQYVEACATSAIGDESLRNKAIEAGKVSLDLFNRSVDKTKREFFLDSVAALKGSLEELLRLERQLDEKMDAEGHSHARPSFSAVREQLEEILLAVRKIGNVPEVMPGEEGPAGGGDDAVANGSGGPGMFQGPVRSREDAFNQLESIADFFKRTEPLSLLAEQIRRIVRLGRMSPEEYFSELIDNEEIRRQMFRLVGIRGESNSDSSYSD